MRVSGWVRVAIVFVLGYWIYGAWELFRIDGPPLTWASLTTAEGHVQWSGWFTAHWGDLAWAAARPFLILLAVGLGLATLMWVFRGFVPKQKAAEPTVIVQE